MNAGQERRRGRAAGILSASSNNVTHRKQARMSSNRKMLKILSLLQFALSIVVILAVIAKVGGQAAAGQGQLDAMRPYLDLPAALALGAVSVAASVMGIRGANRPSALGSHRVLCILAVVLGVVAAVFAGSTAVLAVSAITAADGLGAAVYDGKVQKELEERR